VLAFAAAGWAVPAAAHTQLVSSSPEPGAVVESPASVSLTFSGGLLDIGAQIAVLDAQGGDHASGDVYFPDPSTVQVDVEPLGPGSYTAQWRVVAGDGHPIEGTLSFTVLAPTPAPFETPSAVPSPAASATLETGTPPPPTTQHEPLISPGPDSGTERGLLPMIAVAMGAALLLALAIYLARRGSPTTGSRRRVGR
jgi:hypothetical protein